MNPGPSPARRPTSPQRVQARAVSNRLGDAVMAASSGAATFVVLAILGVILFDVVRNGAAHLSLTFLTQAPSDGMTKGGIFPAIVGMVEIKEALKIWREGSEAQRKLLDFFFADYAQYASP